MLGAMLLLIGNRRFDFVSRQMLRQAFVATFFLLATHVLRDDGLLLFEVRLVDRLGQALGCVGRVVAKIDQQLIRIAQVAFATPAKRPFDLQLELFLLLLECFDLAMQVADRVRLRFDQRHAAQQHGELGCVDQQSLVRRLVQLEGSLFEHAVINPKPAAVPVQDFHPIAAAVDE